MAFRRSGRGGFRSRRMRPRTHWIEGMHLRWSETFEMGLIEDASGNDVGYAHAVQITGDQDLLDVGGESAVIRRMVGNIQPFVTAQAQAIYAAGFRIMQSIQLLTTPRSTIMATRPELLSAWLMTGDGLAAEDILWTRISEQNLYLNSGAAQTFDGLFGETWVSNSISGITGLATHRELFGGPRDWDVDIGVARKLEPEKHLWLVTQVESWNGGLPQVVPELRLNGYLRMLAVKGQ